MAKSAGFKVGHSGSGKHTGVVGDGSGMSEDRRGDAGPRIGPGAMASRVTSEIAKQAGGPRIGGKLGKYSEG